MPPARVADVLAEVFQTYGFDTCQASEPEGMTGVTYRVDLQAEKGGMDVLVTIRCQDTPLEADLVDQQARMVRDVGAYYGVLVCPAGFTESAHHHAARTRTILWDRSAMEALIGRAVLHEILDGTRADPPIAEVLGVVGRAPFAATEHTPGDAPHAHPPTETPVTVAATASTSTPSTTDDAPETMALPGMGLFDDPAESETPEATHDEPATARTSDATPETFDPLALMARDDGIPASATTETETAGDDPRDHTTSTATHAAPSDTIPAYTTHGDTQEEDDREVLEGNGWILETTKRVTAAGNTHRESPPVRHDAPEDRPMAPARPTGLASLAALGGTRRHTKHSGPDPRSFNPSTGALLAPAVDKTRAAAEAKQKIFTIDHTWLRYHPKRVLRWKVEAFVEGQVDTKTIEGVRIVDLATREVADPAEWTASRHLREGTFDVPVEHKPVRIDTEKAHGLAMDSILEATAREVTMEDYDASLDVIMTQKKRIRAHRDDVEIQDEGLHWCPVWCFQGVNGTVEVDALTGAVVDERLEQSDSETIVL